MTLNDYIEAVWMHQQYKQVFKKGVADDPDFQFGDFVMSLADREMLKGSSDFLRKEARAVGKLIGLT